MARSASKHTLLSNWSRVGIAYIATIAPFRTSHGWCWASVSLYAAWHTAVAFSFGSITLSLYRNSRIKADWKRITRKFQFQKVFLFNKYVWTYQGLDASEATSDYQIHNRFCSVARMTFQIPAFWQMIRIVLRFPCGATLPKFRFWPEHHCWQSQTQTPSAEKIWRTKKHISSRFAINLNENDTHLYNSLNPSR